jgi:hypothetical protein
VSPVFNVHRSSLTVTAPHLAVRVAPDKTYCTGQTSGEFSSKHQRLPPATHRTDDRAPDKCPVRFLAQLPERQRASFHRTERTGQNFPVRCSVRCSLNSAPWLGLATGQTGRVTGHVRCTPGTFVRCTTLLCLARAILNREHQSTGHKPPDRTFCPVHCPVPLRGRFQLLFSTPCLSICQPQCVSPMCTCVSKFSQTFSRRC